MSSSATTRSSTSNDEAIARALAKAEQEGLDAELARLTQHHEISASSSSAAAAASPSTATGTRSTTTTNHHPRGSNNNSSVIVRGQALNCPGQHGLNEFLVSSAQRVMCNQCQTMLEHNNRAFGCVTCNYDVCETCYRGRNSSSRAAAAAAATTATASRRRSPPQQQQGSSLPSSLPGFLFPPPNPAPPHMCVVPCVIGHGTGVAVEMMVDTGAQSSVISTPLAQELGLVNRIDRRYQGMANGVGQARIVGKIRNVICELGHVEFPLDFIVLDATEKILLLGLDLMRKFKCVVDLDRDVLVFGGSGGVEVNLLPADEKHSFLRNQLAGGCPVM